MSLIWCQYVMVLRQVVASPYSGVGHVMVSIGIGAYAASRQDV